MSGGIVALIVVVASGSSGGGSVSGLTIAPLNSLGRGG